MLNTMKKINFLILILVCLGYNSFAQNQFYSLNGKKPITEINYIKLKDEISKNGKIEELFLKTEKKKDSIINYIKIGNLATTPDGIDPWSETKKFIGTKFPIENFLDNNSKPFSKKFLTGKPTLINFWFTRCPPCIEELPSLEKLQEKFGNKVNFVSITFENQKAIEEFIKKHKYNFYHIANSKKQIDNFGISAYPTNIILDKNGEIKIVNGEISEYDVEEIETTLKILL